MVQKYYTTKEAAEILGISPAEVNSMRERNELRGYRDGTDWKFKSEDIDEMVRQRRTGGAAPPSFPTMRSCSASRPFPGGREQRFRHGHRPVKRNPRNRPTKFNSAAAIWIC